MSHWVPPGWTRPDERREASHVLVESADTVLGLSDFRLLRDAGMLVAHCSGPEPGGATCPVLAGEECPVLSGADVVLHDLDEALGIADAIRQQRPGLPVVVVERHRGSAGPASRTGAPEEAAAGPSPAGAPDAGGGGRLSPTASIDAQVRALRRALIACDAARRAHPAGSAPGSGTP
jgi:hypothetical protein